MRIRLVVISLIAVSLIPQGVFWFQLANNGGLNWPMHWANETLVWRLAFIGFSIAGVIIARRNRTTNPRLVPISIVLAALVMTPTLIELNGTGLGPSSKADTEELHLMEFWVSGWWI